MYHDYSASSHCVYSFVFSLLGSVTDSSSCDAAVLIYVFLFALDFIFSVIGSFTPGVFLPFSPYVFLLRLLILLLVYDPLLHYPSHSSEV